MPKEKVDKIKYPLRSWVPEEYAIMRQNIAVKVHEAIQRAVEEGRIKRVSEVPVRPEGHNWLMPPPPPKTLEYLLQRMVQTSADKSLTSVAKETGLHINTISRLASGAQQGISERNRGKLRDAVMRRNNQELKTLFYSLYWRGIVTRQY